MLMNDMGDDSRERLEARVRRNAAALAGILGTMTAVVSTVLTTVLPGVPVVMRVVSGVLAVVSGAGIWQAIRGYRSRGGKHLALAYACALGSIAVLTALQRAAPNWFG
ncbi:hypothetical protein [Streptomyces longisporus]|uniref:Uncharacterized protein n=1 Tax=Streptomyces longisporus TaxID=1948 RepID=A0ABN3ND16_STRLO